MKKLKCSKYVLSTLIFLIGVLFFQEQKVNAYVNGENPEPSNSKPNIVIEDIRSSNNHAIIGYGEFFNLSLKINQNYVDNPYVQCKSIWESTEKNIKYDKYHTWIIGLSYNKETGRFENLSRPLTNNDFESKFVLKKINIHLSETNIDYTYSCEKNDIWIVFNDKCKHNQHTPSDKWNIIKKPTFKSIGKQQLYCKYCNKLLKTKSISKIKLIKTKKITFTKKSLSLKKKKTYQLKIKRSPSKANDKLTYKSSNPKIVKVYSNGKIKALKNGLSIITVKAASGKKATIKVIVK